jgi:hypothetical protein
MSVKIARNVLENLGVRDNNSRYGGFVAQGDIVTANGRSYALTYDNVYNSDALDRFLEAITGYKIDFISYAGSLNYTVARYGSGSNSMVRVLDSTGNAAAATTPYTYQKPNTRAITSAYTRHMNDCYYDYYCSSDVSQQYSALNTSSSLYTSGYYSFKMTYDNMLGDIVVTKWDVDNYIVSAQAYQSKESDFLTRYYAFIGESSPVPTPAPLPLPPTQSPKPVPLPPPPTQGPGPAPLPPLPPTQNPGSGGSNSDDD